MLKKILLVSLFSLGCFSSDIARISNKLVINNETINKIEFLISKDDILISHFIFSYKEYAISIKFTTTYNNEITGILTKYPDYPAILYYPIKIFKNNEIINELNLYLEKDGIFSIIGGKVLKGASLFSYLKNFEEKEEYQFLVCAIFDSDMVLGGIKIHLKVNDFCENFVLKENIEEILECIKVEEKLGYNCEIWQKAQKKGKNALYIKDFDLNKK